jgi:hypothetical protein
VLFREDLAISDATPTMLVRACIFWRGFEASLRIHHQFTIVKHRLLGLEKEYT